MLLHRITLQHVRNYSTFILDLDSKVTFIVGPNAAGKTNIVESIYVLATGGPFRGESDAELISWGQEIARLKGNLEDDQLELIITSGVVGTQKTPKKKYLVNGVPRRMIDFAGKVPVVLFWPEDLLLVVGSPSGRRVYLNSVFVQVDREYRRRIGIYEKALRQRNMLLKRIYEGQADRSQLPYWDELLITHGTYITTKRREFITYVNSQTKDHPQFQLWYDTSIISSARLEQYKDGEVAAKTTLVGPHRDDIQFLIKKEGKWRDLALFGSRGEQRLGVLWLKLWQVAFVEAVRQVRPLLLLDDIFSELDEVNRERVLEAIQTHQTVMTSADEDSIRLVSKHIHKPTILHLTGK